MEGFVTAKEAAEKWGVSLRSIQALCAEGRIEGATKTARVWVIPAEAEYPRDSRIKNGNYINWRKPKEKKNRGGH